MGFLRLHYSGNNASAEILGNNDFNVNLASKDFDRFDILIGLVGKNKFQGIRINRRLTIQFNEDTAFFELDKKYILLMNGYTNFLNFMYEVIKLNDYESVSS